MTEHFPPAPADLVEVMREPFKAQQGFSYGKDTWKRWLEGIPGAVEALDSLQEPIDRAQVAEAFESLWQTNTEGAFTAVMVWGYGKKNRGGYRTARVLSQDSQPKGAPLDASVTERLRASVNIVREEGAIEGFRYLNNRKLNGQAGGKIKWLGPAFFTKWLYYASASEPDKTLTAAAPILDRRVRDWLADRDIRIRNGNTKEYRKYIELLSSWGEAYDLAPSQVEQLIFSIS